jgi:hypothetical protein
MQSLVATPAQRKTTVDRLRSRKSAGAGELRRTGGPPLFAILYPCMARRIQHDDAYVLYCPPHAVCGLGAELGEDKVVACTMLIVDDPITSRRSSLLVTS